VLAVGIICASRDSRLLGAIDAGEPGAAASPWVVGITNLGIKGLPGLINFLILLSGWSCGNAYLYASSRTLYGLARDGQAPKFFLKCTKAGVPVYAVAAVTLITCLTFLVSSNNAVEVFYWFVGLTTCALVCTYVGMLWTYIGWYRARVAQKFDASLLPYTAPLTPYTAYFALVLGVVMIIFIGYDTLVPFSIQGFITSYFGAWFSVAVFVFWKVFKRTSFVDPAEADFVSGKAAIDEECRKWEEGGIEENIRARLAEMPFWRRCWERMW
jgi:amino acid transporter